MKTGGGGRGGEFKWTPWPPPPSGSATGFISDKPKKETESSKKIAESDKPKKEKRLSKEIAESDKPKKDTCPPKGIDDDLQKILDWACKELPHPFIIWASTRENLS